MSKKSTYLLWILLTIIIGCFLSWWLCCNSFTMGEESSKNPNNSPNNNEVKTTTSLKEVTKNPFTISDSKTGFSASSENNFNFNQSSASFFTPVRDDVNANIDKLKAYLLENPTKTLDIVGHYKSDETNSTSSKNLGLARANSIKRYLVAKGIPEAKITTNSNLNDTINANDSSVLLGPVTFNLLGESSETTNTDEQDNKADTPEETEKSPEKTAEETVTAKMEALKKSILSNPLQPDFSHSGSNFKISDSQRKKITDIVNYLKNVEGSSLSIIGHTDSSASKITNYRLGKRRADFVKNLLIKNGAPAKKIKTFSKGEDAPIASNATKAGRKKNRRIEYKLN